MPNLTHTTIGSFCRELAAGLEPLPDLLKSWNLTTADYNRLKKNEQFTKELAAAVSDVKELGPDSTFILRCKVLAETFLPNIVGMMDATTTPPDVKAKLFDTITDLARLKPAKGAGAVAPASGPQVVFHFGGGLQGVPGSITVVPDPTMTLEASPITTIDSPTAASHG